MAIQRHKHVSVPAAGRKRRLPHSPARPAPGAATQTRSGLRMRNAMIARRIPSPMAKTAKEYHEFSDDEINKRLKALKIPLPPVLP